MRGAPRRIAAHRPNGLGFRHRFRNLYLFDLDRELILPLLRDTPTVWRQARGDLDSFADAMERLASDLERSAD